MRYVTDFVTRFTEIRADTSKQSSFILACTIVIAWLAFRFLVGYLYLGTLGLLEVLEDVLQISGLVMVLVGVWLSLNLPGRMERVLTRLANRGILEIEEKKLNDFRTLLQVKADQWGHRCGLVSGAIILIAFLARYWPPFPLERIPLTLVEVCLGFLVGTVLGRMALYGMLGLLLKRAGIPLRVEPGHPDGAAGFEPLGDFYFFQAVLVSMPALFLGVWSIIIPFWPRYAGWRITYLGLLPFALVFEILAFLLPIWSFHQEMQTLKVKLLDDADRLSRRVIQTQAELDTAESPQQRELLNDHLAQMIKRFEEIESMPTWPVAPKTRRYFALGNLALLLPPVIDFAVEKSLSSWFSAASTRPF